MKKKIIIVMLIIVLSASGCAKGVLPEKTDVQWYELVNTPKENLKSGMFYVKTVTLGTETEGSKTLEADQEVFYPIYFGPATFEYASDAHASAQRVFKLMQDDAKIPVLYKGDQLIYVNNKEPLLEIHWERFEDMGYSTGISGFEINDTKRYQFAKSNKTLLAESNMGVILKSIGDGIKVVVETFGGDYLGAERISRSGTITGLVKDTNYPSDIYIGTQHFAINVAADCRIYASYNDFKTNQYVYTDQGYAVITLPEGLNPGFYMLNGLGLFCYAGADVEKENDLKDIDFNQGIEYQIVDGETIYPQETN